MAEDPTAITGIVFGTLYIYVSVLGPSGFDIGWHWPQSPARLQHPGPHELRSKAFGGSQWALGGGAGSGYPRLLGPT